MLLIWNLYKKNDFFLIIIYLIFFYLKILIYFLDFIHYIETISFPDVDL